MNRAGLLARASSALCSGFLNNAGRMGDCVASTSYVQSLPRSAGWQHQPQRPSTALTTTSNSVAAVTKSLLVDTLTLVSCGSKRDLNLRSQTLTYCLLRRRCGALKSRA